MGQENAGKDKLFWPNAPTCFALTKSLDQRGARLVSASECMKCSARDACESYADKLRSAVTLESGSRLPPKIAAIKLKDIGVPVATIASFIDMPLKFVVSMLGQEELKREEESWGRIARKRQDESEW